MTTNEELQILLDAATPAPWERPEIDVIGGRITSPHAAKSPDRLRNSSEIARLNRIICIARSNPLADAIVALRRHLPTLLNGAISPPNWEATRAALKHADATLSGCADRLMVDRAKIVREDENGGRHIACPALEGHALRRREVVEVRSADGEDAEDDALLIVAMLTEARRLLTEACPYVVRSVGKVELILDEADAEFFDAQSWHLDNNEVVNRHPIPTPHDASSTRQGSGSPRVRRATFVPYTRRMYGRIFRVISGFGSFGPLAQMRTPLCDSCSSGRHFAYSFLQVSPCCSANGSHHQGP